MNEWSIYALRTITVLCLLPLLLVLLCLGSYLILLEVKYRSRIRRRAQHDYRTARGTQHLRQLRTSLSNLRNSLRARQSKIKNIEKQLELLRRKRSAELNTALSEYLVNEFLTEVQDIGPRLSRRIIQYCFRGGLRDLHFAFRVQGVGPSRQRAIKTWVYAREKEFPRLLAKDFPGKQHVLGKYAGQEASLQKALESERIALDGEKLMYEKAYAAASRFRTVKPSHFRKALQQNRKKSPVPAWYFIGVYPPWEPMPEWFETLFSKYGS